MAAVLAEWQNNNIGEKTLEI